MGFLERRRPEMLFPVKTRRKIIWKTSFTGNPFFLFIWHFRNSWFTLNSLIKDENMGNKVLSFSKFSGRIVMKTPLSLW